MPRYRPRTLPTTAQPVSDRSANFIIFCLRERIRITSTFALSAQAHTHPSLRPALYGRAHHLVAERTLNSSPFGVRAGLLSLNATRPGLSLGPRPNVTQQRMDYITATSRSGDVIHPLLRNVGSGAETNLAWLSRTFRAVCVMGGRFEALLNTGMRPGLPLVSSYNHGSNCITNFGFYGLSGNTLWSENVFTRSPSDPDSPRNAVQLQEEEEEEEEEEPCLVPRPT